MTVWYVALKALYNAYDAQILVDLAKTITAAVLKIHTAAMIVSDNPRRDQFTGKNPKVTTLKAPFEKEAHHYIWNVS